MKVKVLKPIGYGGRQERGEIVEMTEEYVKAFGPDYVVPVDSDNTEDEAEQVGDVKPLKEQTLSELRATAKSLNLSTAGSKSDLLERIELSSEETEDEE